MSLTPLAGQAAATVLAAPAPGGGGVVPFAGRHQAGIATPPQGHAVVAAFDFHHTDAGSLQRLLRDWSAAAARMARGQPAASTPASAMEPPADSGEALGLQPARLTVTFGLGPRLFEAVAGLASRRPAALHPLPAFPNDELLPADSDGDLCVQCCAEDPVVAFHALRMLAAIGGAAVSVRWLLRGFVPTEPLAPGTPRNLMGFKDGTANPSPGSALFDRTVWVPDGAEPAWLRDGSYLVVRRIRMRLGHWDTSTSSDQQNTFGRRRSDGAPLTGGEEHTPPDFDARLDGSPVIAMDAHIRRAHFSFNGGARIYRRGYSFSDGALDAATGSGGLDAGLLFLAYMRDPQQFMIIQSSLSRLDHLNEYVVHVGSALFAVPPGCSDGGYVGETLFA